MGGRLVDAAATSWAARPRADAGSTFASGARRRCASPSAFAAARCLCPAAAMARSSASSQSSNWARPGIPGMPGVVSRGLVGGGFTVTRVPLAADVGRCAGADEPQRWVGCIEVFVCSARSLERRGWEGF